MLEGLLERLGSVDFDTASYREKLEIVYFMLLADKGNKSAAATAIVGEWKRLKDAVVSAANIEVDVFRLYNILPNFRDVAEGYNSGRLTARKAARLVDAYLTETADFLKAYGARAACA